ncbi:trypsin inhibitor ClTI-1-like [Anopheles stephensi]|uniref:Kazal-like domain-containing protein n=1 Tax=Anopheles stephensi TaxID=30069 RepID=A0A182YK08_ANOST|nr:trypsin inhibitor ClTI-1-like [Anopheles stephensi]
MRCLSYINLFVLGVLALVLSANADRPCGCPRIYVPVCGTDLKTYASQCVLDCRSDSNYGRKVDLKLLREGRCNDTDQVEEHK